MPTSGEAAWTGLSGDKVGCHLRFWSSAPDMTSRFARQGVINSADQDLGTEGQQELEDAVAEVVEVPAGLAEEAVKGGVVFEAAQLAGLNDARERAATGAENPGAGQRPERGETGLGKAGLKGEQEGSKGADEEIRHRRVYSFINILKDMQVKNNASAFLKFDQQIHAQT